MLSQQDVDDAFKAKSRGDSLYSNLQDKAANSLTKIYDSLGIKNWNKVFCTGWNYNDDPIYAADIDDIRIDKEGIYVEGVCDKIADYLPSKYGKFFNRECILSKGEKFYDSIKEKVNDTFTHFPITIITDKAVLNSYILKAKKIIFDMDLIIEKSNADEKIQNQIQKQKRKKQLFEKLKKEFEPNDK